MNSKLLRAKMVEKDMTIDQMAKLLDLNPMTVRIKIREDGFKVCEARAIAKALGLTSAETQHIFFDS